MNEIMHSPQIRCQLRHVRKDCDLEEDDKLTPLVDRHLRVLELQDLPVVFESTEILQLYEHSLHRALIQLRDKIIPLMTLDVLLEYVT